jgi:hypothetical protein
VKEWSVSEVHDAIKSFNDAFVASAKEMKDRGVDSDYFLQMMKGNDENVTNSIAEGDIGFGPMRLKRVKDKIKTLDGAYASLPP